MSRRFAAPRRGVRSPAGQEPLGVVTSHGPYRESYQPGRKTTGRAAAVRTPAADAALSAERLRGALSSSAGAPALLQRALPGGGAEVVAVEGAATIPGDEGGQAEAERAKPAPSCCWPTSNCASSSPWAGGMLSPEMKCHSAPATSFWALRSVVPSYCC